MSVDSQDSELSSSSSSSEKRRSTVPDILPHQSSFEKRYSHMIHKQILETGVNKEELKRQINAYFSCGGSVDKPSPSTAAADDLMKNFQQPADQQVGQVEESRRSLDKAETIDIAELQGAKSADDL